LTTRGKGKLLLAHRGALGAAEVKEAFCQSIMPPSTNATEYRGRGGRSTGGVERERSRRSRPECGDVTRWENMVKRERVHGGCLGATVR
jgi:hypothetical protein